MSHIIVFFYRDGCIEIVIGGGVSYFGFFQKGWDDSWSWGFHHRVFVCWIDNLTDSFL